MTSERKKRANRANAQTSTGPRTAAGKARAARNARKHGLRISVLADPALAPEVTGLAREIAGVAARPELYQIAHRIAEAEVDLVRVRTARWQLLSQALSGQEERHKLAVIAADLKEVLAAMDRSERRALSRRKFAIRAFDAARRS